MSFLLAATCTFGMESVLKKEVVRLGYEISATENGRVYFHSDDSGIARANIFFRTADRVHIVLKEFPAGDFDELFEGVKSIEWENIINDRGKILVKGRSKNSKIHSVPVAQSMTKKAIIDRLMEKTGKSEIIEDGVLFPVEIEIENDKARIMLNTSGDALFKRGYREGTGEAPLKETLAAGLILLSGWRGDVPLIDPFCGSGTIPIEAAMIKINMAPGLNRHFLSMKWNFLSREIWNTAGNEAMDLIRQYDKPEIFGYDIDTKVLGKAKLNAENAEVEKLIRFENSDISNLELKDNSACIITNPPYGERLGDIKESEVIYGYLRSLLKKNKTLSCNLITAHPHFQELFGRADKKRKLYNGNLKCNYYSYIK
ncbi:MAG: class I SAM-dependent RNA methyltransferase [Candidatus Delongbacteria bacterium]|nr:class I SAM-dependent RNA methyltransferase [Candidatus Delongbacteria bacterium]